MQLLGAHVLNDSPGSSTGLHLRPVVRADILVYLGLKQYYTAED